MNVLNGKVLLALITLAVLTISTAVIGQDRFGTSDIRGKWYGDDGRTYTFQGKSENEVTLKIEGQETKAIVLPVSNMDEGLVMNRTGPESILHSQYLGTFGSPLFQVSKKLNTVEEYQPRAVPLPILQDVFSKHDNFRSRIDIKIIDKARLELTRHVTSVHSRRGKLSSVNEKAGTETAILTRTKQAKRKKDTGEQQTESGDPPKQPDDGVQDNAEKDQPETFVCFNGGRYVKVNEGSSCARSAEKQLADIDRLIRGLRNLAAEHSDPGSATVQSVKAEVSRLRKDKAQLLEAIEGETEVVQEAKKAPAVTLDLTRTTSTEMNGGGVREDTKDENGLFESAREYNNDGSLSFEKSVKQKYRNGKPAQIWEALYYPDGKDIQTEIKIIYYHPDGERLYKTEMVFMRNRPDRRKFDDTYNYWVWDKSKNDWKPTKKPPVGF